MAGPVLYPTSGRSISAAFRSLTMPVIFRGNSKKHVSHRNLPSNNSKAMCLRTIRSCGRPSIRPWPPHPTMGRRSPAFTFQRARFTETRKRNRDCRTCISIPGPPISSRCLLSYGQEFSSASSLDISCVLPVGPEPQQTPEAEKLMYQGRGGARLSEISVAGVAQYDRGRGGQGDAHVRRALSRTRLRPGSRRP